MTNPLPWISVKDKLPPKGTDVVFWTPGDKTFKHYFPGLPGHSCYGEIFHNDGSLWLDKSNPDRDGNPDEVRVVTHWFEVTTPPELAPASPAQPEPMSYITRCTCGVIVEAAVDKPDRRSDIARMLSQAIRDGLTVERVTVEYVRAHMADGECSCPIGAGQAETPATEE